MSDSPSLTDDDLMQALQAGVHTALNQLMDRWQAPITAFAYRYLQNETDAREIAQETFVRIYRYRARYRSGGKFSTWIHAVCVNLCYNRIRWRKRHPAFPLETEGRPNLVDSLRSDSGPSPDDALLHRERVDAVRRAIDGLPHDMKTAVLLYEYSGLSYEDIADVMQTNEKRVENVLYRARKKLKTALQRYLQRDLLPGG